MNEEDKDVSFIWPTCLSLSLNMKASMHEHIQPPSWFLLCNLDPNVNCLVKISPTTFFLCAKMSH